MKATASYQRCFAPRFAFFILLFVTTGVCAQHSPLPCWNNGPAKQAILDFVKQTALGLPDTHVGTFSDARVSQAKSNGWIVISMKEDWKRIFPFDK